MKKNNLILNNIIDMLQIIIYKTRKCGGAVNNSNFSIIRTLRKK
ncbi:uncharacterized protein Dvar_62540 [Desulfosarcina variabilis str. Montpellier]